MLPFALRNASSRKGLPSAIRPRGLRFEALERRELLSVSIGIPIDLGTLGGARSWAYGINNSGKVVGVSDLRNGQRHAFVYDGRMRDIGTLGGKSSQANDINDAGVIVGHSDTAGGKTHAFLYDGVMRDLGTLGGDRSIAKAINNSGVVVGDSDTAGTPQQHDVHPFLYDGTMHDLGTLGGTLAGADDINDSGQVAGRSHTEDSFLPHPFLYDGALHDLGSLGGEFGAAYAINNAGQVVGESRVVRSSSQHNAFLYDGTMHNLGSLGGSWAYANDINNLGQVVGTSALAGSGAHAFYYDGTTTVDLNTLLPANSGWVLLGASAINDKGQIVGFGKHNGKEHAYLIDVTPEVGITVATTADIEGSKSDNVFGRYISGVSFSVPFVVSTTDPHKLIKSIKYGFDAPAATDVVLNPKTRQWKFTPNVGALSAGADHVLNVAAFDAGGNQVAAFTGTVRMVSALDFELFAKSPLQPVEQLQFTSGVKNNVAFTGEIHGLPQFYANRIAVLVGAATAKNLPLKPTFKAAENTTPDKVVFHFDFDTAKLKPGVTPVNVVSLPLIAKFGDSPELLTAVPRTAAPPPGLARALSASYFNSLGATRHTDDLHDEKEDT